VEYDQVTEAQAGLKGRWALAMEDNLERAHLFATWSSMLGPDQPMPDYGAAIDAVRRDDLSRVVQRYFTPQRFFVGLHQPVVTVASGVRTAGALVGFGFGAWVARRLWRRV
jgi:predicted Zn-dependent peptidase